MSAPTTQTSNSSDTQQTSQITETKEKPSTLKIQIASDIHLEMFRYAPWKDDAIIKPSAKYLALLGDIGCPGNEGMDGVDIYKEFLLYQANRFEQVFVLPGNHEYYIHRLPKGKMPMTVPQIDQLIESICSSKSNLHFLNNKSMVLNGVRIVGSTLWSHIPEKLYSTVGRSMNDYWRSYMPNNDPKMLPFCNALPKENITVRLLTAKETSSWHASSVKFVIDEIVTATEKKEKCLVLTHHAPTVKGTSAPRFAGNHLNCAFSSDLDYLFDHKKNPKYSSLHTWVFGHTHYTTDFKMGNVRIISNQHGYIHEDDPYADNCCIEV